MTCRPSIWKIGSLCPVGQVFEGLVYMTCRSVIKWLEVYLSCRPSVWIVQIFITPSPTWAVKEDIVIIIVSQLFLKPVQVLNKIPQRRWKWCVCECVCVCRPTNLTPCRRWVLHWVPVWGPHPPSHHPPAPAHGCLCVHVGVCSGIVYVGVCMWECVVGLCIWECACGSV